MPGFDGHSCPCELALSCHFQCQDYVDASWMLLEWLLTRTATEAFTVLLPMRSGMRYTPKYLLTSKSCFPELWLGAYVCNPDIQQLEIGRLLQVQGHPDLCS